MIRWLAAAALLVALHAPARADRTQEIRDFLAGFVTDFENLDWPRFRARFTDDHTVFFPPAYGAARATGRAETDPAWLRTFEALRAANAARTEPPFWRLSPQDLLVQEMPDGAVVTFTLGGGAGPLNRRTLVLARTEAGWRIVHLHGSTLPPNR
ncbi:nuclear transport factor 2 family protein [Muricoccus radiodurans]|uniref:nuclear transport factor 2 family protein n=1 Tax=Muricoccus radiodurans TaxID=2231721 RepID=UPI003CEB02E4